MSEKADSATPMLLAESEAATQEVFGKFFEEFQFRNVTVAKAGKEAILAVTKRTAPTYGVIFVSASLNGLNPLKLIAVLRAEGPNTNTPVVFLYIPGEEDLIGPAMAAGASDALEKPPAEDALRATIERFLGKAILTRSEEAVLSVRYVDSTRRAINLVRQCRSARDFARGEAIYRQALISVFANMCEMYRSKNMEDEVEQVLNAAESVCPEIRDLVAPLAEQGKPYEVKLEDSLNASDTEEETLDSDAPILVVESALAARQALSALFEELQLHNVTVLDDGISVMNLDDSLTYELILIGSSLSDMSPLQVLAALRMGEANAQTPVIFLFSRGESPMAEEMKRVGASAALMRPLKVDGFREAIEEVLDKMVASKGDSERGLAGQIQIASAAAQAVHILKRERLFQGAYESFLDVLRDLFLCTAEMYLTKGDRRQAEHLMGEARKIFPEVLDEFRRREATFVQRGNYFLRKGDFKRARAEFAASLTLDEQNADAFVGLGESLLGLEDIKGAEAAFHKAINCPAPTRSPNTLNRLGMIACRHELYDTALQAYEKLLSVYQLDAKLFYNKSIVHVRKREFGKALPLLSRALTLDEEFTAAKVLHKKVRDWMKDMPEVAQEDTI